MAANTSVADSPLAQAARLSSPKCGVNNRLKRSGEAQPQPDYQADVAYYAEQSLPLPAAALERSKNAEVIVIGGGIAGLSSALHLAQQGRRVCLLEARRIAWAASGRNGGQVLNAFACDLDELRALVGLAHSQRLWHLAEAGVRLVEQLVNNHQISCGLGRGSLYVTTKARQIPALRQLQQESEALYHYSQLRWLDRTELPQYLASPRYCAGLYDAGSLHLDPWQYSLGLARAALALGVEIYEHSPALSWQPQTQQGRTAYRVQCPQGDVTAPHLVFCGNTGLSEQVAQLQAFRLNVNSYIIATESLGRARAQALIPAHCAVSDTNAILDYYRLSADHRLIFGGLVNFSERPPFALVPRLRQRLLKVFPQLADVAIQHAWGGSIDMSRHRAPHFGRLAPEVYFAQGFSGHGIALATLSGRLISQAIQGNAEDFNAFAQIPPQRYRGPRYLRRPLGIAALLWHGLRDLI